MDLRNHLKIVLRNFGHAFVSTVHIRLDAVEHQLNGINDQNNNIAATQTALLHAAIHTVEVQQKNEAKMQEEIASLRRLIESHAANSTPANGGHATATSRELPQVD